MQELEKYRELSTKYIFPIEQSNPARKGQVRRLCVLYVIGRFGFSAKVVFEYLLKLPRETINKLFRRLVVEGFINERKSFGSKDGSVYYLTSKGKRFLSYETDMQYNQKTDTSSHNNKTEIHDLSIQICIIDRLSKSNEQYTAWVTEKELRELGYGTFGELKHERAVDALIYHDSSTTWHALEIETANSKNKKTPLLDLRADILNKYVKQLSSPDGLYTRVLFYSHRERFLKQINKRIDGIIKDKTSSYTSTDRALIESGLKYVYSFCPTLYNIFWNPTFKLEKPTHYGVEIMLVTDLLTENNQNKMYSNDYNNGYLKAFQDLSLVSDGNEI